MVRPGFTLPELLIVLATAMLLLALTGTIGVNTFPKHQLRSETQTVVQMLRQAQTFTITRREDSVWGVHLTAADATLFAGASYVARDSDHDQVHVLPAGITPSGLTDVIFEALRGITSDTGTITLTADATSESATITINANGVIEH